MIRMLILLLLLSGPAFAQECDQATEVTSPCTGVLLPTEAARMGLQCLQIEYPKVEAKLKFCNRESANLVNYYSLILKAEQEKSELLGKRIDALSAEVGPRPWWESKLLWTSVGFAVGVSATVAITHAVSK